MIHDGGVSRTPRTWTEGSDEPEDRPTMRGRYEGLEWSHEGASEQAPWIREDGIRGSWGHVLHFGAPLVEVLPDAPEPQPKTRKITPMWREEPCEECGCDACDCDEPRVEA